MAYRGLASAGRILEVPRSSDSPSPEQGTFQSKSEMTQLYDNLRASVESVSADVERAEKGNKAATSRVRKAMQEIKNIAHEIRKEMLELRDSGCTGGS